MHDLRYIILGAAVSHNSVTVCIPNLQVIGRITARVPYIHVLDTEYYSLRSISPLVRDTYGCFTSDRQQTPPCSTCLFESGFVTWRWTPQSSGIVSPLGIVSFAYRVLRSGSPPVWRMRVAIYDWTGNQQAERKSRRGRRSQ